MARPMLPAPTTSALVPATGSVRRCRHVRSRCSVSVRRKSFAKASTMPSAYSAIAWSNTPRTLVRVTSLSTSAGNRAASTPAPPHWIQRSRSARSNACRMSSAAKLHPSSTSAPGSAPRSASRSPAHRKSASASIVSMPGTSPGDSTPWMTTVVRALIVLVLVFLRRWRTLRRGGIDAGPGVTRIRGRTAAQTGPARGLQEEPCRRTAGDRLSVW